MYEGVSGETGARSVLSIQVGRPRKALYRGREQSSAIFKAPAEGRIALGTVNLDGDEQADLVHHGGPDKAVCVYASEHYPHWEGVLGKPLAHGAFGENFTTAGWTEEQVHIGDTFRIGEVLVQISQPRVPCWKLAMKWGLDALPDLVTERGATGYYFRVLETGSVGAGDAMVRADVHPAGVTVAEANRVMHRDTDDAAGIRRLLALGDVLAEAWRSALTKRLAKLEQA